MPKEGLADIRRLISTLLPDLVGRPLVDARMCWCTDTADAEWLFTEDPRWPNLFIASGDSGHSFNTIPYVGHEIADLLEGKVCLLSRGALPDRARRLTPSPPSCAHS